MSSSEDKWFKFEKLEPEEAERLKARDNPPPGCVPIGLGVWAAERARIALRDANDASQSS
jgi:hypothetical protein